MSEHLTSFLSPHQPAVAGKAPQPVVSEYNLRLLDIDRRRIAVIDRYVSWRYRRRPSEATDITVTLPREAVEAALPGGDVLAFLAPHQAAHVAGVGGQSAKSAQAQLAHFVEIYRGTQHVVTGRISRRDIRDDVITLQCHTEEIELERLVTPAQYGRKWDGWDLADVARDMLHGWHVMRVKDQSQWEAAVDSSDVDTSTEPGVVMLAKSDGAYVSSGYIVLRFAKADVPNFVSWDRIRWASDNGAPVRTTMQYRYGAAPESMGEWSEEFEGALPDEIGVVPGTADAAIIDVRINLYTEDQETEDADGNAVGQTPFVFAVELIARTAGTLAEGDIPQSTGVPVSGIEADGATALNVLSQACAQVGWEFWVKDGELYLAEEMGADRTSSVLLRAGTNMTVQTLSEGDDELVNVLTAYGPGEGINRLQVTRRHEASIARYGEYRGSVTFEEATTLADLTEAADAYLDQHAAPVPAFRVEAHYPYGAEPEFGCGDYVRVADPRNGIINTSRIAEEERSYSASGIRTTLYLGLPAPDLARTIRPTPPPKPVRPPDKPVISVQSIPGGIRVIDTTAPSRRWSTSVLHASTSKGFTPSAETVAESGRRARFDITGLTAGDRYYVRLIRFDDRGIPSEPSDEMSAVAGYIPHEDLDPTPPDDVTGLAVDFTGPDAVITWEPAARAVAYRVKVFDEEDVEVRSEEVAGTRYRYTYAMNVEDFGGSGSPSFTVTVEGKNIAGLYSANPAVETATCPAPGKPTVAASSDRAEIRWTVTSDVPPTWKSTTVAVEEFEQTAPVLNGIIDAESAGLADGQLVTLSVMLNDVFGRSSDPREISVTVKYIDKLAFVQSLKPVEIVSALPELPNPDYPQGSVVFLTTDNKLYRSTGNSWTAAVPTTDLSGTITETQIANDAVTTPKLNAGAVTTDKLAAGAVTADKLAANSVTAGKISAGAVTADAVGTNTIITSEANIGNAVIKSAHVDSLSADKISGGTLALTGSMKISAGGGAIEADADGIRAKKNDVTTFEIDSDGNAFFGGALAAQIVDTESLVLRAVTDFDFVDASNEISKNNDTWQNMPGMSLTFELEEETLVFIIANPEAYTRMDVASPFGGVSVQVGLAQTRLLVDGSVRQTGPVVAMGVTPPHFDAVVLGAGEHTITVQWRYGTATYGDFGASAPPARAEHRGIYILKLKR